MLPLVPLALAVVVALSWSGYLVGLRLAPDPAGPAARLAAGAVAAVWWASATFYLLAATGTFSVVPAVLVATALALALHLRLGRGARARLRDDLAGAWGALRAGPGWQRALTATAGLVTALHVLRAAVAPPLGWDAITYHLPKAAMWVQSGSFTLPPGPPSWSYYRFFPPGGDVLWAWAMVVTHDDSLLFLWKAATFLMVPLMAHQAARALGARRPEARLAALAVALTPAVMNFAGSANVDNLLLALLLGAAAFLVEAWRSPSPRAFALVGAALGLAVGVKTSALPMAGMAILALSVRGRRRPAAVAALLGAATIGLPGYLYAAWHTGSPTWPFALSLGPLSLLPGDPDLTRLYLATEFPEWALGNVLNAFTGTVVHPRRWNVGFGPLWPLSWLLATLGLTVLRRRPQRVAAAWLLLSSILLVAAALSPAMVRMRGPWAIHLPRLLSLAYATPLVLGAASGHRHARPALGLLAVTGLALSVPRPWQGPLAEAVLAWSPWLLAAGALGWLAARLRSPSRAWTARVAALGLALLSLGPVQARFRHPIWAQAGRHEVYQAFSLNRHFASAWPIWAAVDRPGGLRLAVTAGITTWRHNWYLYPLLGRRLQNRLVLLPPEGSPADPSPTPGEVARWEARLRDARAQAAAVLPPLPANAPPRAPAGPWRVSRRGLEEEGVLLTPADPAQAGTADASARR